MSGEVRLEIDGAIAIVTNDNQEKRNAFSDAMDAQLFDILGELRAKPEIRAIIWRGEGHSWSSGRDVSAIGGQQVEMTHHELMSRGHRGIRQIFELDAPVIVPIQGWAIGGSFQR
ncbi:MAG: enoyl-CoA hydratase/isomerase family protein, partial [Actinobacteria bacterium]|nr:enoyl-CoA hydratase/isomerase family protein [Actinomycetota bacterium]